MLVCPITPHTRTAGCVKANLSPAVQAIAEEIAFDEVAHVLLLR